MFRVETIEGRKCYVHVFDSISDMALFCETAPKSEAFQNKCSSVSGSASFTGTKSWEEAIHLFRTGWNEKFKSFSDEYNKCIENRSRLKTKPIPSQSFVGYAPNVPRYLMGLPDNMVNLTRTPTKTKIIDVFVPFSFSASVSDREILRVGSFAVAFVDLIENIDIRTNVYVIQDGESDGEHWLCATKIKTDREHMNMYKMVFPMAHPSMLRRIGFRVVECTPGISSHWVSGYGRVWHDGADIYAKTVSENFVVLPPYKDYRNVMNMTFEDFLNLLKERSGFDISLV